MANANIHSAAGAEGRGEYGSTSQYGRTDPSFCQSLSAGRTAPLASEGSPQRARVTAPGVNERRLPDECVTMLTIATYSF